DCSAIGSFNCLVCDLEGLFCQSCIIGAHTWLPFHCPMQWRAGHFQRCTLCNLGYIIALGHGGNRCPSIGDDLGPQKLIMGDVMGVHEVMVGWCRCADAPPPAHQLFHHRMYPASISCPRRAFTF
ncbi:hypothetical protein M422DRAFT_167930, partial [Sphaerobolus stellatus SS14]